MGDTAKRAVESTNVPQLMTALRGRVELAEERLNNMADKSFRALEDELTGVRTEVRGVNSPIGVSILLCSPVNYRSCGQQSSGAVLPRLAWCVLRGGCNFRLTPLSDALGLW